MIRFTVVVRELGSMKHEYAIEVEAPELPREGEYLSIQTMDIRPPLGDDMVVRKVWWRFSHPDTEPYGSDAPKAGNVTDLFVECDRVSGPYTSRTMLDRIEAARARGVDVPHMEVERTPPA